MIWGAKALLACARTVVDEVTVFLEACGLGQPRRPRHAIVEHDGTYQCYRLGRGGSVQIAAGSLDQIKDTLPQQTAPQPVELRLNARSTVTRFLEIPLTSRNHAEAIVAHQIERLTPWTTDNAAYDYCEDYADGQFRLRIVAAARSHVEQAVLRLLEVGMEAAIVGIGSDPLDTQSPIDLLRQGRITARQRMRSAAAIGTVLLICVATGAVLSSTIVHSRVAAAADSLQFRLLSARAEIHQRTSTADPAMSHSLFARKLETPPMVRVLDNLSLNVPLDTHLTELSIKDTEVTLAGFSQDAAALIAILEELPLLSDVGFAGTTTKDQALGRERFEIHAQITSTGGELP